MRRCLTVGFLSGLLLVSTPLPAASADAYLRGYVEAWLHHARSVVPDDEAFDVTVRDGVVEITAPAGWTLPPSDRRLLLQLDGVRDVRLVTAEPADATGPASSPIETRDASDDVWFPRDELFAPLIADQRQSRFHTTYQSWNTRFGVTNIGSVGLGEYFGIRRWGAGPGENGFQVGVLGSIQALFNLDKPSFDLLNADYIFGIPFEWRIGKWNARVQPVHLSSHIGDEFLLDPGPVPFERIDFSYEALQGMGSRDLGRSRVYAGFLYLARRSPDVGRNLFQAGWEYAWQPAGWRAWRYVAAVDLQSWEETDYQLDVSVKTGFSMIGPSHAERQFSVLLEYYNGRIQHGQFYVFDVEYAGLGMVYGF